jgi:hypothetical protein
MQVHCAISGKTYTGTVERSLGGWATIKDHEQRVSFTCNLNNEQLVGIRWNYLYVG